MRVTLNEIEKKLRVSKTAVSMALRNSLGISRSRCQQIQKAAKEMGYVPRPFLSGLAAHRRGRADVKDH
jgi:DNA-binding LacI/PurR family transcriptional regulator